MRSFSLLPILYLGACSQFVPTSNTNLTPEVLNRIPLMMEAYDVDGLSVALVSGNTTLLSKGYGKTLDGSPFSADTACPVYSATKVLTSLTIASMVEDGSFDVNQTLGELLEEAPKAWNDIPFWRLLNHSSGIPMIVNQPVFGPLMDNPDSTNADVLAYVKALELDYLPGEFSRYRQSGYGIAEYILTQKYDKDWPALVKHHVTQPAGVQDTVYSDFVNGKRNSPLLSSAGGYQTTAYDMTEVFKALNKGSIVKPKFLENWLYDNTYDFNDYSLGSVLVEVGDQRTLGHSGGGRANIRYAPSAGVGVMICTDDRSNNNIMHDIANMLMQEIVLDERTLPPIQTKLLKLQDQPAEKIIEAYDAEKNADEPKYDFNNVENTFNQMGYNRLSDGKTKEAIAIFSLNVHEFPTSPNAYDSLAEALLAGGDIDGALFNYQKVLEINPENQHASNMIKKIKLEQAE